MAKTLVGKAEIVGDPKLTIVKAFRIANKRAGEAKRLAADENAATDVKAGATKMFEDYCESLRALAEKAEQNGFHIWVNFNGKTGHTYEKDYKPSADEDNDFEAHKARLEEQAAAIEDAIFPATESVN